MNKVEIKHPRQHNKGSKSVPLQFIAAGTVTGCVARIEGRLTGGEVNVVRHPVVWAPQKNKIHWTFVFRVEKPGFYALLVTGFDNDGNVVDFDCTRSFEVGSTGLRGIITSYPSNGQDITECADYFVAYGVPSVEVVDAEMTNSESTVLPAASLFSDTSNDPPYWYAQFDPLSSSIYRFDVHDAQGSDDPKTNLRVFPPN
jgi:hypothetical protein